MLQAHISRVGGAMFPRGQTETYVEAAYDFLLIPLECFG
jgi:hypothetical protein